MAILKQTLIKPIIKLNINMPKEPTMSITSNKIKIPYLVLLGLMYALHAKYKYAKSVAKIKIIHKMLNTLISKSQIARIKSGR